jgi:hypothetical protein
LNSPEAFLAEQSVEAGAIEIDQHRRQFGGVVIEMAPRSRHAARIGLKRWSRTCR